LSRAARPCRASAPTRVASHGARVFLEAERFDRVGLHGRLPVCTLDALNHAFLGVGSTDWTLLLSRLHESGLVDADTVRAVERLWWFGRLIANTDMHLGNLSFHVAPTMHLAPAYDMLPMAYAPLPGGEVPPCTLAPPLPLPAQREVWQIACIAALGFWQRASTDMRISAPFRFVCGANYRQLDGIAARL